MAAASLVILHNPARNELRVRYDIPAGHRVVSVFSTDGREVASFPVTGSGCLAFGRDLPAGVYFVKATLANEEFIEKIVVTK